MPDHYYSQKPQSEFKTETKQITIKNRTYTFTTSSGVFSKHGIDFGTKLLIEQFTPPQVEGDLLDLGCGYGPIGIVLADHYRDRKVWMVDINERAVLLAKQNAEQNSVEVTVRESDGFTNIMDQAFAAIITNPPIRAGKKVINKMFSESEKHLINGGELWVVVQKKQGAPSIIKYLNTIFSKVDVVERKKGYHIIRAIK